MPDYFSVLKELKMKATPKRLAILEILDNESVYLSPEEIWKKMKKQFKKIGLPTVYRNLYELSEGDIISKVTLPDRQLYYYFCRNRAHHHHFVCLSCRAVEDVNFCKAKELEKKVKRDLKGEVVSHMMQINGICRNCLKKKKKHEV